MGKIALKILAVIILMSYAANNISKPDDLMVALALLETALSIMIIITIIKPLKAKL